MGDRAGSVAVFVHCVGIDAGLDSVFGDCSFGC